VYAVLLATILAGVVNYGGPQVVGGAKKLETDAACQQISWVICFKAVGPGTASLISKTQSLTSSGKSLVLFSQCKAVW